MPFRFSQTQTLLNMLRLDSATSAGLCRADQYDGSTWANPSQLAVDRLDAMAEGWAGALRGNFDAGESATLARQLLFIKTREANALYPNLWATKFIPTSNEIPSGAESFSVKVWDIAGEAKVISDYAQDFPTVNTSLTEVIAPIRSIGVSYSYTIQELRQSAMVQGLSLDTRRAAAARMVHERKVDELAALGSDKNGLTAFIKNANIGLTTIVGGWATATSDAILKDLNAIPQAVVDQSLQIWIPDTLLLPPTLFGLISTKPYSTYTGEPILSVFLKNQPYIRNVDQWNRLDKASASGTAGRIVCYKRDPMCVELEIPQVFEQLAPQIEGMSYKVPCHSRCGGVSFHYPLSATYADGAN